MARPLTRRALFTRPVLPASPPAEFLVRVHRRIMACRVEVVLCGEHGRGLVNAGAALDEADRLEEVMTIFRESSELSRVNREAPHGPVQVGPELWSVLSAAADLSAATEGAFDITSAPLSRCWGFLQRQGRLPRPDQIDQARECVGMPLVTLDPGRRTVRFDHPRVELNLGAIGKGFALDRMARLLRLHGTSQALLSAGSSSILACGHDPWRVDLRTATIGALLARLQMTGAAVGTSGAGEQFFEVNGVRYGHVIDPRSGWPASGVLSASVITSHAASADALSTAFLIGGMDLARRYCAEHDQVMAVITPDDGARRPVTFGAHPGVEVELT
jgi:thiamine biosynthesis lipoprotein